MLLGWICLVTSGCRGCRVLPDAEQSAATQAKEKESPLPRLEVSPLRVLPASPTDAVLRVKSGHWHEFRQQAVPHYGDETVTVQCSVNENVFPFHPLRIPGRAESLSFQRRAGLARGQRKNLAFELFMPPIPVDLGTSMGNTGKPTVRVAYQPRTLGPPMVEQAYPITSLADYQYRVVVLSQNPSRYQYLNGLSCMTWPSQEKLDDEKINPYQLVSIAQADAQLDLPARLATWTAISHLLWNDCNASALSQQQHSAILDWLHFGGQIIVNGPESQSALQNSFLEPYLPLNQLRGGEIEMQAWDDFNRYWTIPPFDSPSEITPLRLPGDRIPSSVSGALGAGCRWVQGCEGLVAERIVGMGRVVMTTFSLSEKMIMDWPSFGSFVNAALLDRPPREWYATELGGDMRFAEMKNQELNPLFSTRLRLLGRDLGTPLVTRDRAGKIVPTQSPLHLTKETNSAESPETSTSTYPHRALGQLDSDSLLVRHARGALQQASGIQVPRLSTILRLLAGYFVVLVPLNWLVFRFVGRVEYAWLAAPVIALIGAVVVARSVQLDVGFSRSQATLNVLDLPAGYPRGQLSSFLSLYTSLSTNYSLRHPANEGIVLPIGSESISAGRRVNNPPPIAYRYADDAGAGLQSFTVRSNSTSTLRSEEVIALNGPIDLQWDPISPATVRCQNDSSITIQQAGVFALSEQGERWCGWLGVVAPASEQTIPLVAITRRQASLPTSAADAASGGLPLPFQAWNEVPFPRNPAEVREGATTAQATGSTRLQVGPLMRKVLEHHRMQNGEACLIGWTEDPLAQLDVQPKASQHDERSLVFVRLGRQSPSAARPDRQLPSLRASRDDESRDTTIPP